VIFHKRTGHCGLNKHMKYGPDGYSIMPMWRRGTSPFSTFSRAVPILKTCIRKYRVPTLQSTINCREPQMICTRQCSSSMHQKIGYKMFMKRWNAKNN